MQHVPGPMAVLVASVLRRSWTPILIILLSSVVRQGAGRAGVCASVDRSTRRSQLERALSSSARLGSAPEEIKRIDRLHLCGGLESDRRTPPVLASSSTHSVSPSRPRWCRSAPSMESGREGIASRRCRRLCPSFHDRRRRLT